MPTTAGLAAQIIKTLGMSPLKRTYPVGHTSCPFHHFLGLILHKAEPKTIGVRHDVQVGMIEEVYRDFIKDLITDTSQITQDLTGPFNNPDDCVNAVLSQIKKLLDARLDEHIQAIEEQAYVGEGVFMDPQTPDISIVREAYANIRGGMDTGLQAISLIQKTILSMLAKKQKLNIGSFVTASKASESLLNELSALSENILGEFFTQSCTNQSNGPLSYFGWLNPKLNSFIMSDDNALTISPETVNALKKSKVDVTKSVVKCPARNVTMRVDEKRFNLINALNFLVARSVATLLTQAQMADAAC